MLNLCGVVIFTSDVGVVLVFKSCDHDVALNDIAMFNLSERKICRDKRFKKLFLMQSK